MMRVRLKADGRIVEILADGSERPVDHSDPAQFVRQVRARCGLTQAAFAEKIEVPQAEVDEEIAKMAEMYRTTPEEIKASLEREGGAGTIANNLKTRRSIEVIIENAKVTDGPWVDESQMPADAAAEPAEETKEKKPARKKPAAKKATKSKAAE